MAQLCPCATYHATNGRQLFNHFCDIQFPAEAKRPSPQKSPDVTGAHLAPYSMGNEGRGPSLQVK